MFFISPPLNGRLFFCSMDFPPSRPQRNRGIPLSGAEIFCMMPIKTKTTPTYFAIVLIFVGFLLGLRWVWGAVFPASEHISAVNGVLDLRGRDLDKSPTFALDGQWQFYPGRFIRQQDVPSMEAGFRTIQVPGDWSGALQGKSGKSYGYGTYRLRILFDPVTQPVSLWIQGIQTSSAVTINGIPSGQSGSPAEQAATYTPKVVSFTPAYNLVEGTTEIDVLIHAANFADPYKGGILQTLRFGSQAAVDYARWYSIGFQMIAFVVLMLHSLYAFILFSFNPKERSLLLVCLLTLLVSISITIGNDNLLLLWLPIGYTWALKIRVLSLIWHSYLVLVLFRRLSSAPAKSTALRVFTASLIAYSGFALLAPSPWVNASVDIGVLRFLYVLPFLWFMYLFAAMVFRKPSDDDNIFFLLSAAGIMSSSIWSVWDKSTTVFYPVDIIIAIIGYSTYWFKKYFRNASENALLNEQLRKADKLKDQFLANTSHELKTPLHGIINIAQVVAAKEKDKLSGKSLKDMELLITISRRMSHLLGDLLDVAQLREQRIVLQREPLLVQSLVPGVISMLKFMTEGKPVRLEMGIAESMPPVMADEKRLLQILHNLLHNAIKFTEEGTITVSAEKRDGRAVIHVSDTGAGMDEDTQARVFQPYEQGAYGIGDGRGIGLGLSICKQLVELHGGNLTVRSRPEKGSIFSFDLPLAGNVGLTSPQDPLHPGQTLTTTEDTFPFFRDAREGSIAAVTLPPLLHNGRANILAVDDDPVNLSVLVGILSTEPYTITTAHSAREALSLLGTRQWDLLIADVMMPYMSGYELTQRIREHYSVSELPVLLLTARSLPADIYTGFSAGANDYVTKPVDALELKYRISALIRLKQSINERLRMEAAYLQAQIHPHFLFNTLNSIMALSEIDTEKMQKLGQAFATFLRVSFDFMNTGELVELAHELELAEAYLYIEKERFENKLAVIWEVEPGLNLLLPPLTIQPLIENAVKHGLFSRSRGGTLHIRIVRQESSALVEVMDDGIGMDQETVHRLLNPSLKGTGGIGIFNTNRRLIQLYGRGLSIVSKPGEGTIVSFAIPDR